jgi:hypothetical protein
VSTPNAANARAVQRPRTLGCLAQDPGTACGVDRHAALLRHSQMPLPADGWTWHSERMADQDIFAGIHELVEEEHRLRNGEVTDPTAYVSSRNSLTSAGTFCVSAAPNESSTSPTQTPEPAQLRSSSTMRTDVQLKAPEVAVRRTRSGQLSPLPLPTAAQAQRSRARVL